jgi:hypothetical protein
MQAGASGWRRLRGRMAIVLVMIIGVEENHQVPCRR